MPAQMSAPYRTLFAVPGVPLNLTAVLVSALPLGMANLAVILSVQQWTGSVRTAGLLAGLFGLANAVGLLVQGRLIDRLGAPCIIAVAGACSALAMAGAVFTGMFGGPQVLLAMLLAVAGLTVPAITAAVRAWLTTAVSDEAARTGAYALLSVLFQSALTVGPLLVSAAVLLAGAPLSLAVAAALTAVAAGVFLLGARRTPAPDRKSVQAKGSAFTARLVPLLGVAALTGLAAGMTSLAVPGLAAGAGAPAVAGFAFSAAAVGEMGGALVYGGRRWRGPRAWQLRYALAASGVVAVVTYAAAAQIWLLVPAMLLGGLVAAPVTVLLSTMLDDLVPAGVVGQAYSLLVAVGLIAAAAGNAVAGVLAAYADLRLVLLVPAALFVLSIPLARRPRRR